jgi:hypothetical protein
MSANALITLLIVAQICTASLCAWLWARVTAMPTHADLQGLRVDIRATTTRVSELAETVAGLDATAEQTLQSVRVIQSYLMERER